MAETATLRQAAIQVSLAMALAAFKAMAEHPTRVEATQRVAQ
jgi:hypothetical protein